jgi:hypothetical protein
MMGITDTAIELIRATDLILAQEDYLSANQIRRVPVTALVNNGAFIASLLLK